MNLDFQLPFLIPPPMEIIYRMFFDPLPVNVNQACGLMASYVLNREEAYFVFSSNMTSSSLVSSYKQAFEVLKKTYDQGDEVLFPGYKGTRIRNGLHKAEEYNNMIIDLSNSLWRNRAFPCGPEDKTVCFASFG
jgi:hypothetical protein